MSDQMVCAETLATHLRDLIGLMPDRAGLLGFSASKLVLQERELHRMVAEIGRLMEEVADLRMDRHRLDRIESGTGLVMARPLGPHGPSWAAEIDGWAGEGRTVREAIDQADRVESSRRGNG